MSLLLFYTESVYTPQFFGYGLAINSIDNNAGPSVTILEEAPSIMFIDSTNSVFTTSTITYNQSDVTYNDATKQYGGSDRNNDSGPSIISIGPI